MKLGEKFVWLLLATTALMVTSADPASSRVDAAQPIPTIVGCFSNDNGDPILTDFQIDQTSIDVTAGRVVVTFTAQAHDTGGPGPAKGVGRISINFEPVSGGHYETTDMTHLDDGTWIGTISIPPGASSGKWLAYVTLEERKLDSQLPSGTRFYDTSELAALGFDSEVMVNSVEDVDAPTVSNFDMKPQAVDTRKASRLVNLSINASDGSGIGIRGTISAQISNPSLSLPVDLHRKPGTNQYQGQVRIPTGVGSSSWRVDWISAVDKQSNFTGLTYGQLITLGYPAEIQVRSGRAEPPRITSFQRRPARIDARTRAAQIHIKVQASSVYDITAVDAVYTSPTGYQRIFSSLKLSKGTRKSGVWTGTVRIPRCQTMAGSWTGVIGAANSSGEYISLQLTRRTGMPGSVRVKAQDHTAPVSWVDQSSTAGLVIKFNESVHGLSTANSPIVLVGPTAEPAIQGTWKCVTKGSVATSCDAGQVREATFVPAVPFQAGSRYRLMLNPEHRLDLQALSGNPFVRYRLDFIPGA